MLAAALMAFGCASVSVSDEPKKPKAALASMPAAETAKFEQDRKAILAMAGDFDVTFDFRETVALTPGYELKKPKLSGADEIVRVVEDSGDFISLQQILVMKMGDEMYVTKHWRQDWKYEPAEILVFIGGNAWERRCRPADGPRRQVVADRLSGGRFAALRRRRRMDARQWRFPVESARRDAPPAPPRHDHAQRL